MYHVLQPVPDHAWNEDPFTLISKHNSWHKAVESVWGVVGGVIWDTDEWEPVDHPERPEDPDERAELLKKLRKGGQEGLF